jgi:hypothetical protein
LVRVGDASVAAGVAGLALIGLCAWVMHGSEPAGATARAGAPGVSVFGTIHPPLLDYGSDALERDVPRKAPVRLASLESTPVTTGDRSDSASFDERFFFDGDAPLSSMRPSATFDDRFNAAIPSRRVVGPTVAAAPAAPPTTGSVPATPVRSVAAPAGRPRFAAAIPLPRPAPKPSQMRYQVASLSATPPPSSYASAEPAAKEPDAPEKDPGPLGGDLSHTAIYDISAKTVYMPNGDRLEAHSGLAEFMDDVRAVSLRKQGPTPPNVYELRMRESLFHGVQAIRLVPVDGHKMYGRDGILAHPFMLRANGESNGCVSFRDYPAFLKAYQRGEITRMVVVEQLDDPPGGRTASDWVKGTLKKLFGS